MKFSNKLLTVEFRSNRHAVGRVRLGEVHETGGLRGYGANVMEFSVRTSLAAMGQTDGTHVTIVTKKFQKE
jgi:hypothetical protein